jgi:hypothetical protein
VETSEVLADAGTLGVLGTTRDGDKVLAAFTVPG